MSEKDKNVAYLPPFKVKNVVSSLSQVHGWGITQLNVPTTWSVTRGENITVMVIDTGYSDHSDLNGAILKSKCKSYVASEKDINDYNGHGCVTPDTVIYTTEYGLNCIIDFFEKIDSNDIIVTNNDIIKKIGNKNIKTITYQEDKFTENIIQAVHKIKYEGDLIKITYGSNKSNPLSISLTPWHPIYIYPSRGESFKVKKIRADELQIGDTIICNNRCFVPCTDYVYLDYVFKQDGVIKQFVEEKERILIDEDFAWFLGFIITDGHIQKNSYRVEINQTIHNNEAVKKFMLICDKMNIKYTLNHKKTRNDNDNIHVYFNNKKWWEILKFIIGSGNKTYNYNLPTIITKSPLSVGMSFIAGCIDGNGCVSQTDGRIKITTASNQFANQLKMWLMTIGFPNVSIILNKHSGGFTKNNKRADTWNVKFKDSTGLLKKYIAIKRKRDLILPYKIKIHKTQKILSIDKEHYDGYLYDFTIDKSSNYIANGIIVSNTHCLGIIGARDNDIGMVGVAPKCKIITVKVLGSDGTGDLNGITKALKYAIKVKPNIINMSLGTSENNPVIHELIKKLYELNIPIISAAGNDGKKDSVNYPAAYPETICVTAYDKNGKPAKFNSTGKETEFSAPGVDIYSTWLENKYSLLSGTSMATPFMTGLVALLLSKHIKQEADTGKNDCKTIEQIREHLLKYADNKGIVGHDDNWGYGVIDPVKLILENDDTITTSETKVEKIKYFVTIIYKIKKIVETIRSWFKY